MFVLPSVIFGFLFAILFISLVINRAAYSEEDMGSSQILSDSAVLQAILLGTLIPVVSSIIPIRTALSKNLNESLDLSRVKVNV